LNFSRRAPGALLYNELIDRAPAVALKSDIEHQEVDDARGAIFVEGAMPKRKMPARDSIRGRAKSLSKPRDFRQQRQCHTIDRVGEPRSLHLMPHAAALVFSSAAARAWIVSAGAGHSGRSFSTRAAVFPPVGAKGAT
jgi:hypothetical protein